MSCFIVSDNLVNDTLNFIYQETVKDPLKRGVSAALTMHFCDYLKMTNTFMDDYKKVLQIFGRRILEHNFKSWNQRYPKEAMTYEHDLEFVPHYETISLAQFLKNVDCIDYQCCEVLDYETNGESIFWDLKNIYF